MKNKNKLKKKTIVLNFCFLGSLGSKEERERDKKREGGEEREGEIIKF